MTDAGHDEYESADHVRALRLILASLRKDWPARDEIFEEIGDCSACLRSVAMFLAAEAATAYVGPPEETVDGFVLNEEQVDGAIDFIGDIIADVLDHH